jgi:hypothetical protein
LDGHALAALLTACFGAGALPTSPAPGTRGIAIDCGAPRGRLRFAHTGCPVHALRAFCHDAGIVLAHEPIAAGLDTATAELTVVPALLARIA